MKTAIAVIFGILGMFVFGTGLYGIQKELDDAYLDMVIGSVLMVIGLGVWWYS